MQVARKIALLAGRSFELGEKIPRFVIVGGGTAGWLAAFVIQDSLKRRKIDAKVIVIESSKIPTVGVGEGSTAAFRVMMQYFKLDEFEFFRETGATFKLGIRHKDWRRKGFTYDGPIDDPHQVVTAPRGAPSDYLNVFAVAAGRKLQDMHLFGPLLEQRKAPYALKDDGSLVALGPFHHAFHFDQARVGQFLKKRSKGVEIIDATIAGVERDRESGDIKTLVFDNGERLDGDFFVDASGFRKRLIVQELNAPWLSYAKELPVNRAMPFWLEINEGEEVANYTLAHAMGSGWMWQIPTQWRYGCGYVYSDEFLDPEGAKREIEAALGREIEVRDDIHFKLGRLETPWAHNCLAVGLSSSFLEPLEATSIHGSVVQLMLFADRYLKHPDEMREADRADYNKRFGRQVDDFRTFVNTHYVTEREDTPFWRNVRAERLHAETQERLARWKNEMPRREHFGDFLNGLPHVETQLHYPVLDGLGLLDPVVARAEMERDPALKKFARETADGLVREYRQVATKALGHREFLERVNSL
jgi:glycine/D-amino acid oxidase-like deaminating enzyme